MSTIFVSRHAGALHWMQQHGPAFDRHVEHLDLSEVAPGDRVIGTLPVHLAAQVCACGAAYWHLALQLPAQRRGQELGAAELQLLGATLERFHVVAMKEAIP